MKKQMALVVFAFAVLFVAPSLAACSGICSTSDQYSCSKSISTLTRGTSTALTVTITNQQSQAVTSLSAQLQGSWFTASSSSTTISSIQASGGTANADFSITPTVTGGQDVCVYLGSTCTADCGTITVTSPAELSITSMEAPSSAATSSAFTVSATIANSGTETAGSTSSVTATLTSSQCTVASETKTVGTVAGSGTSSVSWSVTAPSSATTCTFSLSASGTPGGSATGTKSVTVSSGTTTTAPGSSSSSSSGGGSAITGAAEVAGTKIVTVIGKSTITVPEIKAGASALIKIDKPAETSVRQIAVAVKNTVSNITIIISKAAVPAVPADGKIFSYLQIDNINITDADISAVTIDFQIDKAWLSANKIDKASVALNRLVGDKWAQLTTKQIEETDTYSSYRAESPGLSVFAITGKELPAATPTTVVTTVSPIIPPAVARAVQDYGIWIAVFVVIAVVLGYLYYHHEHARKTLKKYSFRK